jgi:vitamin B12 transporter
LCVISATFSSILSLAQHTVPLQEVEINVPRRNLAFFGKKTERVDSLSKAQFPMQPVSEVLNFNSTVFIKSYGPGSLASSSFRGGSAEQTAILWEGFNLQNAMLGQTELSLLPSVLFDEIRIEYGGSSAVWGSGAVGGSIHLGGKHRFGEGIKTSVMAGAGTVGQTQLAGRISQSGRKASVVLRAYTNHSQNQYNYIDRTSGIAVEQKQKLAAYQMGGMLADVRVLLNGTNYLDLNAWLSDHDRTIPPYTATGVPNSQQDRAIRTQGGWTFRKNNFLAQTRGAFFRENIKYFEALRSRQHLNVVNSAIGEHMSYLQVGKARFNAGLNYTHIAAESSNYQLNPSRYVVSAVAGAGYDIGRVKLQAAGRAEYYSRGRLPFTGNISAEYEAIPGLTFMLNAAKVYRQPTLNELYWQPGGNPDLKAEEGYTGEGAVNYAREIGSKVRFEAGAAAYVREIVNWVLWVPGANGNPSPLNVQSVWSRGSETTWKLVATGSRFQCGTALKTAYVLSTISGSRLENSNSIGRQLIYTPRYTGSLNVWLARGGTVLSGFLQYAGYRFTVSDNSAWLDPYYQSMVRISQRFRIRSHELSFFVACHNLLNQDYQVLPGRPMPLRNYEAGLQFNTGSISTTNKKPEK